MANRVEIEVFYDDELNYTEDGTPVLNDVELAIDLLDVGDVPKTITLSNGAVFEIVENEGVTAGTRQIYTLGKYIEGGTDADSK